MLTFNGIGFILSFKVLLFVLNLRSLHSATGNACWLFSCMRLSFFPLPQTLPFFGSLSPPGALLPARWSAPRLARRLSPAHEQPESRGRGRGAAQGAGPPQRAWAERGAGRPSYICACAGAAAGPVGTEETRWRCGRWGGSWTGPRLSYQYPPAGPWLGLESRRWQLAGTTSPSLVSVSIREQDESCLCS